jgi:phosphoribosylformylglycinamidine synthase
MSDVRRVFVEKKKGYDTEAKAILQDLLQNLNMKNLKSLRLLNRYDVEGLNDADFNKTLHTIFSEPPMDKLYLEDFEKTPQDIVFGVEYLPGQYDQRSDSASQCIALLTLKEGPEVRTAKIFVLSGKLTDGDVQRIKEYLINPVDSQEAALAKPGHLKLVLSEPGDIAQIDGFIVMDAAALELFRAQAGFAMSIEDLVFVQGYFKDTEKRDPTETELKVIDTYWSDHCRHTTFLTRLEDIRFGGDVWNQKIKEVYEDYLEERKSVYGDQQKDVCLMDMATLYVKSAKKQGLLPALDVSDEINACTIREKVKIGGREEDYLILFKNETHNHPTEIEPFGGAATCLGGAIRDPLSGRAYVYQAMRVTGSGDPREKVEDTLPHKLPQKKITTSAAHGYSSYGNQIGLATGIVREIYHPGYKAKRMEIGAVIGAAPAANIVRETPVKGDVILLIGGRTGRDGCGGATGSSKAHDERSIAVCGAEVQKGNPLTERKLQRLFRNAAFSRLVKKCNDFGAGGVCVAIGELSPGIDVNLDLVPKKYEGLNGTELAISESQERMAVVIEAKDTDAVLALAAAENLEAIAVARVTDTGRMRLFWRGKPIVDIERDFLDTNGATQTATAVVQEEAAAGTSDNKKETLQKKLNRLLSELNICSQRGLIERFDSTIGAGSVLMPFGGKYSATPAQVMAARVPSPAGVSDTATVMSFGFDPYLSEQNAFSGAVYAVVLSLAKLVSSGAAMDKAWLTLQEYFPRLHRDEYRWGKPVAALLGAFYAQKALGIAAIGGKDSMSGSFMELDVPSTLVSFAVAAVEAGRVISPEFKKPGSKVYLLDIKKDAYGLPVFEDIKEKYAMLTRLIAEGKIYAAYAVEQGGLIVALAKMCFGNRLGVQLEAGISQEILFGQLYGALIMESDEALPGFVQIGQTMDSYTLVYNNETAELAEVFAAYEAPLEKVFPTRAEAEGVVIPGLLYKHRSRINPAVRIARPHVVIPVFPGTNCEYDTARAFEKAGAKTQTVIIRNQSAADIGESIDALKQAIHTAQIIVLPGGFSGGDEPEGSGKFIATVFRNPYIKEEVTALLNKRGGLMLGICNGFQALIKLGLVPYGKIVDMRDDSPTLTYNTIGRHMSAIVRTRVTSLKSPWLSGCVAGEIHSVAVSHGEGRFVATQEEIEELFANGQVATQYVDLNGEPGMDITSNPNGSMSAIEGILSPDGRVFGKMAHSERFENGLLKNVYGEKDQKIFAAGVQYFK